MEYKESVRGVKIPVLGMGTSGLGEGYDVGAVGWRLSREDLEAEGSLSLNLLSSVRPIFLYNCVHQAILVVAQLSRLSSYGSGYIHSYEQDK